MRKLLIQIELNGENVSVGEIAGKDSNDACFTYAESYASNPEHRPISISLPLEKRTFDAQTTRNFFEGLLPEGFTRRCVAEWMHAEEKDYLSILAGLGQECLGAIKVIDENTAEIQPEYRKLTKDQVLKLAKEGATESAELVTKSHLSLTGASGKVGLYYDGEHWFLPIGEAPSTHIVKQSHIRLKKIVCNEQLCLLTAKKLGIEIPDSFIINLGSTDDEDVLFATKRYDRKMNDDCRILDGMPVPFRLHQEDFSQALGISSAEKYEKNHSGYMRKIFEILRNYSGDPIADQMKLWDICVFNYLVGNTDNHIKNISLLYSEDLKSIRLAPAYDIVSTMIYESSTENMALSIGGVYCIYDITRESFEKEARNIGLGSKMAMKRFDLMVEKFPDALRKAADELKQQGFEGIEEVYELILKRNTI
jgi:serine/threonine-protein kinase HipA